MRGPGNTVKLAALLFVLAAGNPAAATQTGERIDALLSSYVKAEQFNGSALVAMKGAVVLKQGYGMANFEWGLPNAPDTRFRLGSVTKQFTSMLVMQLVEEGKLSLDAKVTDVLPWYRSDAGGRVTIHNLLSHTSGIPNYTAIPGFMGERARQRMPLEKLVKEVCSGDLEFEPGSQYRYSNSGYVILGAIIEKVTGEPYAQVLQERILDPVGMKATGYDLAEPLIEKRAGGYERLLTGIRNAPFIDMSVPHAAGAMYSTVEDLYLWDRALYGDSLLSARGKERMFTPVRGNYAYGWGVRSVPIGPDKTERLTIRHAGGINGFHSLIVRIPADGALVVLLNNLGEAPLDAVATGVLDILYGREPAAPKRAIADVMIETIGKEGVAAALAQYRELKARQFDAYDFSEKELNSLGYALLGDGRTGDAIELFKLNVEAFPESGNVYDSLAEGYMKAGDKELAIKNYARSLQLDPGNENAVSMLQELVKR